MRRPVVGISCYAENARWGQAWDMRASLLPQPYVDAVAAAGAVPVLLPPVAEVEGSVARLDGLLLAGGADIGPEHYGEGEHEQTVVQPYRDTAESALLAEALRLGVPVLGICRGAQLLNVARGGKLHQHLPEVVGNDQHRRRLATFDPHPVKIAPNSRTAKILGCTATDVPSYHHQGIAELGHHVIATAWADDGTVEAVEYADRPDVVGVQWHPEMGEDPSLFTWLAERGRARMAAPAGDPAGH